MSTNYKNSLTENRSIFHQEIRQRNKRQQINAKRQQNLRQMIPKLNHSQLNDQIQMLIRDSAQQPLLSIQKLVLFLNEKQQSVLSCIQWHSQNLLNLCANNYPNYCALELTYQLTLLGVSSELFIINSVATKICDVIKNNIKESKIVVIALMILMEIAYQSKGECPELEKVKDICIQLYTIYGNHRQLIYLISFLGYQKKYFPADETILKGIIAGFGQFDKQMRLIAIDVIGVYIQLTPPFLYKYCSSLLSICLCMSREKDFCASSSNYYRKYSFKCIILLLQQFSVEVLHKLVSQNVMIQVINLIQVQTLPIKQVCFSLLQNFCKEANSDQILELIVKFPGFVEFLQIQGLDSSNPYILQSALETIYFCLSKFNNNYHNNTFKNLLDQNKTNFMEIIDNLGYHKFQEVSSLAIKIYEQFYKYQPKEITEMDD